MLSELNYTLEKLQYLQKELKNDIFDKNVINNKKKEIDDFSRLQEHIQQHLLSLKDTYKDVIIMTQAPLIHIDVQLSNCCTNIELVQDLVKEVILHLSERGKDAKDG